MRLTGRNIKGQPLNCQYKILKKLIICFFACFASRMGGLRAFYAVILTMYVYYVICLQLSTNAVDNYVYETVVE